METLLILFFGFLFGAILQYASLNKYDVISGLALRTNFAVPKAIAVAIGLGMILLNIEIGLGWAAFHTKPLILGGIMLGGLIFGSGMAILGYCPGTLAVSLGEGSLDALIGIIGGLAGGWIFTLLKPAINPVLGPDLGKLNLATLVDNHSLIYYILVFVIGSLFIAAAFALHKKGEKADMKWLYSGVALAILDAVVFLSIASNRPIGASTTFPYIADVITNFTNNAYFEKIQTPGHWEMIFLSGAFLAALIISLIKGQFKLRMLYGNWEKYKGTNPSVRAIWAFVGGFILIFGARMAGGCTSGHILSGGMQIAFSSLIFAFFVFAGLLITGKVFYKK